MDLWRSLGGMVEVELTSADTDAALQEINERDIAVYQVAKASDLTILFQIKKKDYTKLSALCHKKGETLKTLRHKGLYWTLRSTLQRPILTIGILGFLCLALWLPSRVFFIRVEGNGNIPTNRILSAAENAGIRFGASRREVRSEKVKNALLSAVPELQWAGLNTSGCTAIISVQEKSAAETEEKETVVSSIIAATDGVVYSCTATRGTLLCSTGEMVRKGQILISGYADCGLCIQATQAEGEIYAQTNRQITSVIPAEYIKKADSKAEAKKYSVLLGKKRINLWKGSGIWDTSCDRMYEEYYITLPGGFSLPFGIAVETVTLRSADMSTVSQEAAAQLLSEQSNTYITSKMVAGKILAEDLTVAAENGYYSLAGNYICTEMIGREQQEQIGEHYGKNS